MKDTKMIRIVSRGFVLSSRGRIMTPVMSPYRESISRIWSMITTDRADVEEKLPDGTFVKLTAQNFDKDNYVSKEIRKEINPQAAPSKPVETFKNTDAEPKKEEVKPEEIKVEEPKVEEKVEEPVTEEATEEPKVEEPAEEVKPEEEKVEESKEEASQPTVTVNGEKRVDPRFNKKNKNKNRNNQNNNNNQSIAVDAEEVE